MDQHPTSPCRPSVGAIRWDAWHGDRGMPGRAVQKTLSPARYHHRLPFFARITAPNQTVIDGATQAVMDREIAFAAGAGLDYWAFVTYEPDTPMSLGMQLYLASDRRSEINFCLVTEQGKWGAPETADAKIDRFVSLLCEPTYQKVLAGRPLVYLGFLNDAKTIESWGSWDAFRAAVDRFRLAAVAAGAGQPYIVIMDFNPGKARQHAQRLGADAISAYALPGGSDDGTPFVESMQAGREMWQRSIETGADVVPLVSLGWDPRPRIDNPVPWHKYARGRFYASPTPDQAAWHVRDALRFCAENSDAAETQAVLIYAWNENDEGAWLVPTIGRDGRLDDSRLRAVGKVLAERR